MKKDKIVYNKKELLRKDNIKMNKEINVGITIKNIRKSKKLLLKDVALKCGISSSMLSQIE